MHHGALHHNVIASSALMIFLIEFADKGRGSSMKGIFLAKIDGVCKVVTG